MLQALLLAAVQGKGCCQRGASCLGGRCTLAQESVQWQPCGVGFSPAEQYGAESVPQHLSLRGGRWLGVQLYRSGELRHGSCSCLAVSQGHTDTQGQAGAYWTPPAGPGL